jgi:hypothetical protein
VNDDNAYVSEFGISMVCTPFSLFRQSELAFAQAEAQAKQEGYSPHLYILAQRPRVTLDPKSVVITKDEISGRVQFAMPEGPKTCGWSARNPFADATLVMECPYPYSEFALRRKGGALLSGGECAMLVPSGREPAEVPSDYDLKVVYVGQAFGDDGDRDAFQRLRSHSTLQEVYADAMREAPHMDVWLMLLRAEATQIVSIFPSDLSPGVPLDESLAKKTRQLLGAPISLQQRINFTEAALIRYFSPSYNTVYKDRFPHPGHKTYAECYAADVNVVCAELQTLDVAARTFSDAVAPAYAHIASYALRSNEERRHMFAFVQGMPMPHGPVPSP